MHPAAEQFIRDQLDGMLSEFCLVSAEFGEVRKRIMSGSRSERDEAILNNAASAQRDIVEYIVSLFKEGITTPDQQSREEA